MLATTAQWQAPAQRVDVPSEWTNFKPFANFQQFDDRARADLPILFLGNAHGREERRADARTHPVAHATRI
jgi:hypothetical protein